MNFTSGGQWKACAVAAAAVAMAAPAEAFVAVAVDHGAATAGEQIAFDRINRFRANPTSELAAMFTENFAGDYSNGDMQTLLQGRSWSSGFWVDTFGLNTASASMDAFQTNPGALYTQFQSLTSASALSWSNSLGWSAHQYSVRVELDAGASSNPHAVAGAPTLVNRFNEVGMDWLSVGENVVANSAMSPAMMHMAFAVDWGPGPNGILNPAGHRNTMLDPDFDGVGIGITNHGWGPSRFTGVQHFVETFDSERIAYGFVFEENGLTRKAGVLVTLFDASGNPVGTGTTNNIGAYTVTVPDGATPVTAVYDDGVLTSPRLALGSGGGNWFLDVTMAVPEPSSALLVGLGAGFCLLRRRRSA